MYRCFAQFGFDLDISPTHSIVGLCSPLYYYALINDFEYLDKLYALFEVIYIPLISAFLQTIASVLFCLFPLLAFGSMFWLHAGLIYFIVNFIFPFCDH